jgi:hypothetical protein
VRQPQTLGAVPPPARGRSRHACRRAQRGYLSDQVWGLILVAGLFSLLVGGLIAALERWTLRHRPTA